MADCYIKVRAAFVARSSVTAVLVAFRPGGGVERGRPHLTEQGSLGQGMTFTLVLDTPVLPCTLSRK